MQLLRGAADLRGRHCGLASVIAVADQRLVRALGGPDQLFSFHRSIDHEGEVVYQLVMPEDADVEKGLISTSSPIGRAFLNKEEGDEVTVSTPNGTRKFEILKLVTIHDD